MFGSQNYHINRLVTTVWFFRQIVQISIKVNSYGGLLKIMFDKSFQICWALNIQSKYVQYSQHPVYTKSINLLFSLLSFSGNNQLAEFGVASGTETIVM